MKKYRLKKDLPFAKAGDIFKGELEYGTTVLFPEDYENYEHKLNSDEFWDFDEWFEEDIKIYFTINFFQKEIAKVSEKEIIGYAIDNAKNLGLLFETKEEAERYIEYLKAKAIIKKDTKGFKPSLGKYDKDIYYFGIWDCEKEEPFIDSYGGVAVEAVKFKTPEDIEKSFKKHPEEWKTFLTYEQ